MCVSVQHHAPTGLLPGKKPGAHWVGWRVGFRRCLELFWRKERSLASGRIITPGHLFPGLVAISTTLSRVPNLNVRQFLLLYVLPHFYHHFTTVKAEAKTLSYPVSLLNKSRCKKSSSRHRELWASPSKQWLTKRFWRLRRKLLINYVLCVEQAV